MKIAAAVTESKGAPFEPDVDLEVNTILAGGRVVRGIVEGGSVPDAFLPRLETLHRQGRYPSRH